MITVDSKTKVAGVIGWPIDHSLSPKLHNFIAEEMGHNMVYTAMPVKPEVVDKAIEGVRALGIAGINATAPHKFDALRLVDEVDKDAQIYGSVNTVVNRNGKLKGYSTDGPGLALAMKRSSIEIENKNVLIYGAGGVAGPVCVMLASEKVGSITVINRTLSRAFTLKEFVKNACGFEIEVSENWTREHYDIIINCTSMGMLHNREECPMSDFSKVDSTTTAVDLIYNPPKTKFLKLAEEKGAKIMNGLGMLVYQGVIAYEKIMDCTLPEDMGEKVINMLEKEFSD